MKRGDTIVWEAVAAGPHRVNFGANSTTSATAIKDLLDFTPPGINNGGDSAQKNTGLLLSATVKDVAGVVGKTFTFTCGVHPGDMKSLTFTIAEKDGQARTHRISGEAGRHWHFHVDTTPPAVPQ